MRTAQTERADTLHWLDGKLAACGSKGVDARHFEALREEIAQGLHERNPDA